MFGFWQIVADRTAAAAAGDGATKVDRPISAISATTASRRIGRVEVMEVPFRGGRD